MAPFAAGPQWAESGTNSARSAKIEAKWRKIGAELDHSPQLTELLARWRPRIRAALPHPEERVRFWRAALVSGAFQPARDGRWDLAQQALEQRLDAWLAKGVGPTEFGPADRRREPLRTKAL